MKLIDIKLSMCLPGFVPDRILEDIKKLEDKAELFDTAKELFEAGEDLPVAVTFEQSLRIWKEERGTYEYE